MVFWLLVNRVCGIGWYLFENKRFWGFRWEERVVSCRDGRLEGRFSLFNF